jgi:hypothetical protein
MLVFAALAVVAISTTSALAEMPKALKGSWILDAEATEANFKASPEYDEEAAKFLPMIFKQMSKAVFEFDDGVIALTERGKKQPIPITLKENDGKKFIFEAKLGKDVLTFTITLNDKGNISIVNSKSDNMDLYLWKRGVPDKKAKVTDAELGAEIAEKVVNDPSAKKTSGDDK